jgi:hypothetical protein
VAGRAAARINGAPISLLQGVTPGTDVQGPPAYPAVSEATRLLSAAVHLDRGTPGRRARKLRAAIREQIDENPFRALGVSPGVDLRSVVANCRAAERRLFARDAVLTLLLVATVVLAQMLQPAGLVVFVAFVLACEVVYAEAVIATWGIVARRFGRSSFAPPPADDAISLQVVRDLAAAQDGNVTVYSGFSPFVGAGLDAGGWSFALNATRGKETFGAPAEPQPFTLDELYRHVDEAIESLGLPGLSVEDRLFVEGRALGQDGRFLAGPEVRPATSASPTIIEEFLGGGAESVRHYKTVRVVAWGGELVLSIFLRFSMVQHNLFAETSYFLLPPVEEAFHEVDRLNARPTWSQRGKLVVEAACATPVRTLAAPFNVVRTLARPLRRWLVARRVRREIKHDGAFDYGAPTSIRDAFKSPNFRQYFQKLDREMCAKVIERELFDCIVAFLDARDIDTTDLKERESTILNNGVIVTGGSIQAESMAVGERARAFVGQAMGRAGKATPPGGKKGT